MNDVSSLSFSRWLKRLRAQHDLTQEALAELAYCSVQTIRFFESGKRRPSLEMAERLAEVLEVPAEQQALFIKQARTSLHTGDDANGAAGRIVQTPPSPAATDEASSAPPPAHLPLPATVLVGRQPEATRLHHLLIEEKNRLVTLVGPGGIGKTRLALHMAHMLNEHFAHGAFFVPLVSISQSGELPSAIAGAMSASLASNSSRTAQLNALLAGKSLLLVLDNFEHLLALDGDATTALIDHIMQHLPGVYLLVTSRERLRLHGESILELGGLMAPKSEQSSDAAASDAVILFLQRARQVSPSFALTPANRAAIVRLCNLLSGMPLGIELAAAWVRTLTPEEIATEIGRSLDFLTLADRGAPVRHRSLRAAFEHSWKLLAPEEQKAAARLSIFRGGFRREAAQAVAGAHLPLLAALIDKSLVQVVTETAEQAGGLRYDIHELLRQYLREKLVEMGDEQAIARRHIEYYLTTVELTDSHHYASVPPAWFRQMRSEQGNLRTAMEWALNQRHAPDLGLRLVGSLGRFWYMADAWIEGCKWLRTALALVDSTTPPRVTAALLSQLGDLEHAMAEYAAAQEHLGQALALWRTSGDQARIAWNLFQLGVLTSTLTDFAKAEEIFNQSLAIYRSLNHSWFVALVLMQLASTVMQNDDFARAVRLLDEAVPIFRAHERTNVVAVALNLQGWSLVEQGNYPHAIQNFQEALAVGQEVGNLQSIGWSLRNLGMAHLLAGRLDDAESYLRSCLRLYKQITFKSGMVIAFEGLAGVAAEKGEYEQAVGWLAVAETLRDAIGLPRTASEERLYCNRANQLSREALSQAAWDAAWKAGSALTLEQALAQAT